MFIYAIFRQSGPRIIWPNIRFLSFSNLTMTERERVATSFMMDLDHWTSEPGHRDKLSLPDGARRFRSGIWIWSHGVGRQVSLPRHVNISKYLDILLIILLSQKILIRPFKKSDWSNNWRRYEPRAYWCNSWMRVSLHQSGSGRPEENIRDILCCVTLWAGVKNDV